MVLTGSEVARPKALHPIRMRARRRIKSHPVRREVRDEVLPVAKVRVLREAIVEREFVVGVVAIPVAVVAVTKIFLTNPLPTGYITVALKNPTYSYDSVEFRHGHLFGSFYSRRDLLLMLLRKKG